jgi:hypothetical protein
VTDEPELNPAQEAEVSRLLAETGGPVTTPAEVVERLDEVLAGLVEERARPPAAPRSHRRWPQALLAAAAVVVVGYGVGVVVTGGAGGDASSPSADSAGDSAASGARPDSESLRRRDATTDSLGLGPVVRLHADRLESEVERVVRQPQGRRTKAYTTMPPEDAGSCRPPRLDQGATWYVVRLDGRPATLVTEPARHGRVRVAVWGCDGELLARTSVQEP